MRRIGAALIQRFHRPMRAWQMPERRASLVRANRRPALRLL
jgi:hypothetical protein